MSRPGPDKTGKPVPPGGERRAAGVTPKALKEARNFFEALPLTRMEKHALRARARASAALKIQAAILRARQVAESY